MKLFRSIGLTFLFFLHPLFAMELTLPDGWDNDIEEESEEAKHPTSSIVNLIRQEPEEALKLFCDAARNGNSEIVQLFLDAQENIRLIHTGLLVPLESGRPGLSMAEAFFRAAGIKKDWRTPTSYEFRGIYSSNAYMEKLNKKQLPLKRAVSEENLALIKLFVENGADIHAVDDFCCESYNDTYGYTSKRKLSALELAVKIDNAKMVEIMLLEKDHELPANDLLAKIALYAARYNSINTIEFLDSCSVDWNALMKKNTEALNEAAKCHSREVTSWFLEHIAAINDVLLVAARQGYKEAVALLLAHGASGNYGNREGETPLMAASWSGQEDVVRMLLEAGVRVNSQNNTGETALMGLVDKNRTFFWRLNHRKIAKQLIAHGADVNIPNGEGKTAAVLAAENKDAAMVDLLLGQNNCVYNMASGQTLQVGAIRLEQQSTDLLDWTQRRAANLFEQAGKNMAAYFGFY